MASTKKKVAQDTPSVTTALESIVDQSVRGLTGIVVSEKGDLAVSLSRLVRHLRGGQFLKILNEEWKELQRKGSVKEDYGKTNQGFSCLQEIVECIETETLDEVRFRAIKALFLTAAQEKMSNREEPLPLVLLQTLRQLGVTELIVLFAAYRCHLSGHPQTQDVRSVGAWLQLVADESGLKYAAAVETAEDKLVSLRLIGARLHSDRSGISETKTFRLTRLAIALCQFVGDGDQELVLRKAADGVGST